MVVCADETVCPGGDVLRPGAAGRPVVPPRAGEPLGALLPVPAVADP